MGETKKSILKRYIDYRSLTNHSNKIKDIEFHTHKFLTHTNKPLSQFTETLLVNYLNSIKDKYSTTNFNIIKSSYLKNFIKWHFKDYSVRFPNLDRIMRGERAAPSYTADDMLSEKDFEKLMKAEDSSFWKAYFMTMFYGGCRPNEVIKLKRNDVEFADDGAYITIYSGKNKREFIKFIPSDSAFYLKKIYDKGFDYIFTNERTQKPISVKGAYWKIRQLSEKALGHKIDLYTLRHSIATIIYNKDDIKDDDIARQMGHTKSQKGTYVHNDKKKLRERARKIYVSPEELPPEKKHELEKEVEKLKEEIKKQRAWTLALQQNVLEEQEKILKQIKKTRQKNSS